MIIRSLRLEAIPPEESGEESEEESEDETGEESGDESTDNEGREATRSGSSMLSGEFNTSEELKGLSTELSTENFGSISWEETRENEKKLGREIIEKERLDEE